LGGRIAIPSWSVSVVAGEPTGLQQRLQVGGSARLWVDPQDENHLFNADVKLRESTDGAATWHASSGPHADQHAMKWDPARNRPFIQRVVGAEMPMSGS
jgi:hypothetical protein